MGRLKKITEREFHQVRSTPELFAALRTVRAATGESVNTLLVKAATLLIRTEYRGIPEALTLLDRHEGRLALEPRVPGTGKKLPDASLD